MTAKDAPQPEADSLEGTVKLDSLDGILRTGGEKTAGCGEKGRQNDL